MFLKELNIEEFANYQANHPLSNFYQTINYALLMAENGYDYDLIGLVDEENTIHAASLILLKPIGIKCFYGYAPRGFLIDYNNQYLLNEFTKKIKEYYYNKNVIFIKLNPNIPIGSIDNNTYFTTYNENKNIINSLISLNYKKLKDNLYFEAQLPRFNAIIDLTNNNPQNYHKNTKNKIKKGLRKGLTFEKCGKDKINEFYQLIKNKKDNNEYYYQDYYTVFEKEDNVDLFLVSIDYKEFLENSQYIYNEELNKNNHLNEKLIKYNTNDKNINNKMNSDKNLLSYKNDIMEATKGLNEIKKDYIAGALVIRHNNTASIIFSGYDNNFKRFAPNYFLHYNLIKFYQNEYNYLDLNGIVGDFNPNPYSGLNKFKLGFNPNLYEYIGEFDLIIEPKSYDILLTNGILAKEFNKKDIKKI